MNIDVDIFRKQYEDDLMTFRELSNFYGISRSFMNALWENPLL